MTHDNSFDAGYEQGVSQQVIFDNEVSPFIGNCVQGYNTTVFCYGITGSGKTYTMQGTMDQPGIIYRTAQYLLQLCSQYQEAKMTMSYLEIYNEKIYDLLKVPTSTVKDLPIREDSTNGNKKIVIPGLSNPEIRSYEEFIQTFNKGLNNRKVASTKLNSSSSRSHAILSFTVTIRQMEPPFKFITGKLNLADLAGSEDNRRTGNTGTQLVESSAINMSLMTLRKVVTALNEGKKQIPYRESKVNISFSLH